jgi:hypothetical protein
MAEYLITTQEAYRYVAQFEDCTLPKEKWTHEMHLIVGMYIVLTYKERAVSEMKERIWRYNEAVGKGNDNTGYHHTLTVFWLWRVKKFCDEKGITQFNEEAVDELIFDETLAKRKMVEDYYHIAVLMSPFARRQYVPADLKDMEGVEYFLN